ncbi:MAG TPA: sensor histidine kinase [Solirubrobacteraceae bacterium]|jgi:signal transduction histidine kinase|nr:sensor histidine kinase [Solirubrobacteraceae bacterium]
MRHARFPAEPPEHRRARALDKRVADLRTSRERILAAADAERRRIERDLHDGAQQRMVAVAVTLGLAQAQLQNNPEAAAQLIEQARGEAQLAVKELRELARGIHPAVLSDHGLAAALDALAARAPVPVEVTGVPENPLPRPVEAAVYFVTAEALTNIAKYAKADAASVNLAIDDGHVLLQITDDGVGGADTSGGTGLSGLCDRVEALDGTIDIESPAGGGTAVRVQIPLTP